jgi:hypothetical protein
MAVDRVIAGIEIQAKTIASVDMAARSWVLAVMLILILANITALGSHTYSCTALPYNLVDRFNTLEYSPHLRVIQP